MKRTRPVLTTVISSLEEANEILVTLGSLEREIERVKQELEESVASMREVANVAIAPMEKEHASLLKSLNIFADQHRSTLLVDNKKSVVLPGGEFGWRLPPTKVTLSKGGEEKALKTLTELNLKQYIRLIPEVDREALLKDRPHVPGIKYSQKENFYVKPESAKEPQTFPGSPEAKEA
jgi:phage host-nuclease inhibitor protein Gam